MAEKTIRHVRPREAFSGTYQGAPFTMNRDMVLDANDPIVKRYKDKFVPLEPGRARPSVEQMTKAPGEIRF
jgi:hypothetical protein